MRLQRYITGWLLFFLTGCMQLSPQQRLTGFINDPENKIVQSIKVGEVNATVKWLPYQYRNPETVNNTRPIHLTHEDYCYFNIRFEKSINGRAAGEKVMYLNFDMQKDFTLLCAGDSISPAICQKIENGVSGSYEYMLAFNNSNRTMDENDFTLFYKDKVFGIGVLAFVYRQKDIRKIFRL